MSQEIIAYMIVSIAALVALLAFFRSTLAGPIANVLLRRGSVKLAMKLKAQAREPGCGSCEASKQTGKKLPTFPRQDSGAK